MSIDQAAPAARPRRNRLLIIGLPVAVAVVLLGLVAGVILSRGPGKIDGDPAGTRACTTLADWIRGDAKDPETGKPYDNVVVATGVSGDAAASKTAAIRAAVGGEFMDTEAGALLKNYGGPASFRVTDLAKLHAACTAAGMKMPADAEPK